MKLDKDVIRRRVSLMKDAGVLFKTGVEIGVDVSRETLEKKIMMLLFYAQVLKMREIYHWKDEWALVFILQWTILLNKHSI